MIDASNLYVDRMDITRHVKRAPHRGQTIARSPVGFPGRVFAREFVRIILKAMAIIGWMLFILALLRIAN
jgi:hypothetical protein